MEEKPATENNNSNVAVTSGKTELIKNFFDENGKNYSQFRPMYPRGIYMLLRSLKSNAETVRDCGTGTGQVALGLAELFPKIIATDKSEDQIKNAKIKDNIQYMVADSENVEIQNDSIDIITVGSAIHRFNLENFYRECLRVSKNGGLLAVWTYGKTRSDSSSFDDVLNTLLYASEYVAGPAKTAFDGYNQLHFPFEEISDIPTFTIEKILSFEDMCGYIETTSLAKNFLARNSTKFTKFYSTELQQARGEEKRTVYWDVALKIGVIKK